MSKLFKWYILFIRNVLCFYIAVFISVVYFMFSMLVETTKTCRNSSLPNNLLILTLTLSVVIGFFAAYKLHANVFLYS